MECPREVARWRAQRDQGREQARLGVREPEEHVRSGGDADADHRVRPNCGDHGPDVPGVILDMVGARQRIGRA